MDVEKTYFSANFDICTSVSVSYAYLTYLQKMNRDPYTTNNTLLRKILVETAIEIINGKKIDDQIWEESIEISDKHVMALKINEPIKQLIDQVVLEYFFSVSHFVRYVILKACYQHFPRGNIKTAKVVSLGKLF